MIVKSRVSKQIFTMVLLLSASYCSAQRQNVYFLKNSGRYVKTKDSADYIRVIREPDSASSLYNVLEYYKNGSRKLVGKSSTINPIRFEGPCVIFYPNGHKKNITSYVYGLKSGDEYCFYPNGKLYLTEARPENPDRNHYDERYLIKESNDSLGTPGVVNGSGYFKGFAADSTEVYEEGPVKNGKKDGAWKGSFKLIHATFTENYEDGTLVKGEASYDDGETVFYTQSRETEPQFTGGQRAFGMYLAKSVHYPAEARENNEQGMVVLSFIVEKDGKIGEVKIVRPVSRSIDNEAVRVIKNSPPWKPGMQFGRPVKVLYSVPVNFSLSH